MRVLFVTHNAPRHVGDVAGSFVLRLAVALQAAGARVEIVAPGAPDLAVRDVLDGVVIHRVRYAADARMTLAYEGTMVEQVRASWSARFALLGMLRALRRETRRHIADAAGSGDPFTVVHTHWWFPSGLALWHGIPAGPTRVVTMHGSDVRLAAQMAPARRLMRSVLAQFDVHTAVSSWLALTVQRIAPRVHVDVAPMPVDDHLFAPAPEHATDNSPEHATDSSPEHATEHARQGILFVGRLNAQKGIADVLSALAQPVLAHATLDVVGDGPDRASLEAQAAASGIVSRIRWHRTVAPTSLAGFYQRARVVVMPSRNEGLGLVAVEAQLCGTPVVGYASGGLVDVVQAGHGGTLVPEGNVTALAEELAVVYNDAAEAGHRGQRARAFMQSRFSPDVVAKQYLALYAMPASHHRPAATGTAA